jgi:hypothetical protein
MKQLLLRQISPQSCQGEKVLAHRSQLVSGRIAIPQHRMEARRVRNRPGPQGVAAAPQFDYPARLVGKTTHFAVYSARSLRQPGQAIAQAVLQRCESDYAQLAVDFALQPAHFNIVVAPLSPGHDGTGGAYHHSCIASDLYCDAQLRATPNPALTSALVVAEEVEVFEAAQDGGWDCGSSNGEGLSRVLAEDFYPGVLDDYSTAAAWLDGDRPDWVNNNESTDTDPVANGCSVLFLFWLRYQLGFGWDKICQAPAPTLAQTAQLLTGSDNPFDEFSQLLEEHFPSGQPSGVTTDNPFPL